MHLFEGPDFGRYEENLGREEERERINRISTRRESNYQPSYQLTEAFSRFVSWKRTCF